MDIRVVAAGDAAWLVELPEQLNADVNARAIAIAAQIDRSRLAGVTDVVVGYRSVMVYVDPLTDPAGEIAARLASIADATQVPAHAPGALLTMPVCYGGVYGPDLDAVASFGGVSTAAAVDRHAAPEYRVYMVGFVPGFAYLAEVDRSIAAPRRSVPRLHVPPGSVAIANGQTGIYPADTPGGWNIVGRCPIKPYDPSRGEPFLFRPGDRVRFQPIDEAEYRRLTEWGDA